MKRTLIAFLTTIALLGLPLATFAKPVLRAPIGINSTALQDREVFHHQGAGIQFELPKGWKAKPDGETITVSSGDDGLQIVLWVPAEDEFEDAVKALDKELGKTIKNIKVTTKGKEDTHNGMPHFEESGSGDIDGTTIEWSVDLLAAKKLVLVLTFAAPQLFEKHADAYGQFVHSIKKSE